MMGLHDRLAEWRVWPNAIVRGGTVRKSFTNAIKIAMLNVVFELGLEEEVFLDRLVSLVG